MESNALRLLSTAAESSPRHPGARAKQWPSIRVGLDWLGLSPECVAACRQYVLQVPGEAEAALMRLQAKLEVPVGSKGPAGSLPLVKAALESLQVGRGLSESLDGGQNT